MVLELESDAARDALVEQLNPLVQQVFRTLAIMDVLVACFPDCCSSSWLRLHVARVPMLTSFYSKTSHPPTAGICQGQEPCWWKQRNGKAWWQSGRIEAEGPE